MATKNASFENVTIYSFDKETKTFTEIGDFDQPYHHLQMAELSDFGIERGEYKFEQNHYDINQPGSPKTIKLLYPYTRTPGSGDGYTIEVNSYAKLYKKYNKLYYVGGFTIH